MRRRTEVQRTISTYVDLEDDLIKLINNVRNRRDDLRESRRSIHNQLRQYTEAHGDSADLYYGLVDRNIERFPTIHSDLTDISNDLNTKLSEVRNKLSTLRYLRQQEEADPELEYTLTQISNLL